MHPTYQRLDHRGAHGVSRPSERQCVHVVRRTPGPAFGVGGPGHGRRRLVRAGPADYTLQQLPGSPASAVSPHSPYSHSCHQPHHHSRLRQGSLTDRGGTSTTGQLRQGVSTAAMPARRAAAAITPSAKASCRSATKAASAAAAGAGATAVPGLTDSIGQVDKVVETLTTIPLVSLVVPEAGVQAVDALIVGGGPAGLAAALMLHKRGWERIVVLEQQASVTQADITKSYVYAIDGRGRKALDLFGLTDKVMEAGAEFKDLLVVPTKGPAKSSTLAIRDPSRRTSWMPRAKFLELLYSAVQAAGPAIQVVTGATCTFVGRAAGDVTGPLRVEAKVGGDLYKYDPRLLVGADGIQSVVREQLQQWYPGTDKFKMQKFSSPAAGLRIKVLVVPPNPTATDGTGKPVVMTNNAACVAAGNNGLRLGMLPIKDLDRPRTANVILKQDNPFWKITDPEQLLSHFEASFPQLPMRAMIGQEQAASFAASSGTVFPRPQHCPTLQVLVRSDPRWGEERAKLTDAPNKALGSDSDRVQGVLLLGDAIHCFPPDLGQGVNSALEDIWALNQVMAACGDKVETALPEYERRRLPDVKALVQIARFGYPYQYNHDAFGKALWSVNFAVRMGLTKLLPFLVAPPSFLMIQDASLSYSEILARASRTTRLLWTFAAVGVLALLYFFFGGRPAL